MTEDGRAAGGGWRPNPQQELLLQAALLADADAAFACYRRWKAGVDLDDVDGASYRLLPLLHKNLRQLLADDPDLPRLAGVYRRSWYRNRLLVRGVRPVFEALDAAGIAHLALKGAALGALHYADSAARPMDDLDILVPMARGREALDALVALGWHAGRDLREPERELLLVHSVNFGAPSPSATGSHPAQVDLHWRPLYDGFHLAQDQAMWDRSVRLELDGVHTRALEPTDQFLHVCVHGLRWNPVPPIRWVADAVMVARGNAIEWDRLVDGAARRGLAPSLARVVGYLDGRFGVDFPPGAQRALRRARTTPYGRFAFWARTAPPSGVATAAQVFVVMFADRTRGQSAAARVRGYPRYLKDAFGQPSLPRVAQRVVTAGRRRPEAR